MPLPLSAAVAGVLSGLGVSVDTGVKVTAVTSTAVHTADGTELPASLVVWAAGIRAPAFLHALDGLECDRIDRLVVDDCLRTTVDENIFAFGDCAACPQPGTEGRNVPPRAQAAHQQASLLSKSLRLKISAQPLPEYRYRDYGSLISLSTFSAVGNLMGNLTGSVMLEGWLARMFYVSLYRMHQIALYGATRTLLMMLGDRIGRSTEPRLKLH